MTAGWNLQPCLYCGASIHAAHFDQSLSALEQSSSDDVTQNACRPRHFTPRACITSTVKDMIFSVLTLLLMQKPHDVQ